MHVWEQRIKYWQLKVQKTKRHRGSEKKWCLIDSNQGGGGLFIGFERVLETK